MASGRSASQLKLLRVDPSDGTGLELVFIDGGGKERRWKLESTSQSELMALMLRGSMRDGQRVVFPQGEVSVASVVADGVFAELSVLLGATEIVLPMTREAVSVLAGEVAGVLSQAGTH